MIYLDNSALSPILPEIKDKVAELLHIDIGNPSSLHELGQRTERILTAARESAAGLFGCSRNEVIFTGSGTEANNLAIIGGSRAKKRAGNKIVITEVEHPSVTEPALSLEAEGFTVTRVKPRGDGNVYAEDIVAAVDEETVLVSAMYVNNELGSITRVGRIREMLSARVLSPLLHYDCVAAAGKLSLKNLDADLISVSGHKIHGLTGTGALYVRKGVRLLPLTVGGGQEFSLRSGTENILGIYAFGLACDNIEKNLARDYEYISDLGKHLREKLEELTPYAVINSPDDGAAHILNVSFRGMPSQVMMQCLESEGIYVSAGAACSAKLGISKTLLAYGVKRELAMSAVRISTSAMNTKNEIDTLVSTLKSNYERHMNITRGKKG